MRVSIDGGEAIAWEEFLRINEFSSDEAATIRAALDEHGLYEGGGGAAAEFTVEVAPTPPAFHVTRLMAQSKMWAYRDLEGEFGFTAAKRDAHKFTENEADIFVAGFAKYSTDELEIIGAGRGEQ